MGMVFNCIGLMLEMYFFSSIVLHSCLYYQYQRGQQFIQPPNNTQNHNGGNSMTNPNIREGDEEYPQGRGKGRQRQFVQFSVNWYLFSIFLLLQIINFLCYQTHKYLYSLGRVWIQLIVIDSLDQEYFIDQSYSMRDINLILSSEVDMGAVYISDLKAAQSPATLRDYRIGAIVSVTRRGKLSHTSKEVPRYLYLPVEDSQNFDISQYFQISYSFIEESRKHTNVLVHCIAGVSRSATIVAAYLIRKKGCSASQSIDFLKKKRRKISPNKGFRMQLEKIGYTKMSTKTKEDDQQTLTSPLSIRLQKKQIPIRAITAKESSNINPEQLNPPPKIVPLSSANSQSIPKTRRLSELSLKRQKTVQKIERMKASLVSKLVNSSIFQAKTAKIQSFASQQITFQTLLQSKIYQNKLKINKY